MGDCLHIRAIVRQILAQQKYNVWLETSWVALYHDLIAQGLKVVNKATHLRTQTKNAVRERNGFSSVAIPHRRDRGTLTVSYNGALVKKCGSVLAAMMAMPQMAPYGLDYATADFRLPVPEPWHHKVDAFMALWQPGKPLMVYRPLVVRKEWGQFNGRNPDPAAYARIYRELRERYFVVSIADLVPAVEWTAGEEVATDAQFHRGELEFETLAALFSRAALVYASPGFAVPLAQAVGTPVICMFGGYENSSSFVAGARYSRYLGLDVIKPCSCFSHTHRCDKRIDVDLALQKVRRFVEDPADHRTIQPHALAHAAEPALYEQGRDRGAAVAG